MLLTVSSRVSSIRLVSPLVVVVFMPLALLEELIIMPATSALLKAMAMAILSLQFLVEVAQALGAHIVLEASVVEEDVALPSS